MGPETLCPHVVGDNWGCTEAHQNAPGAPGQQMCENPWAGVEFVSQARRTLGGAGVMRSFFMELQLQATEEP